MLAGGGTVPASRNAPSGKLMKPVWVSVSCPPGASSSHHTGRRQLWAAAGVEVPVCFGLETAVPPGALHAAIKSRVNRLTTRMEIGTASTRSGYSAADLGHRLRRLDEPRLVDQVPFLFAPDRGLDHRAEVVVRHARAHQLAQRGLVEREEAGAQAALRGEAGPVGRRGEC